MDTIKILVIKDPEGAPAGIEYHPEAEKALMIAGASFRTMEVKKENWNLCPKGYIPDECPYNYPENNCKPYMEGNCPNIGT